MRTPLLVTTGLAVLLALGLSLVSLFMMMLGLNGASSDVGGRILLAFAVFELVVSVLAVVAARRRLETLMARPNASVWTAVPVVLVTTAVAMVVALVVGGFVLLVTLDS